MKRKYSIVLFLIAGFLLSIVAHAQERDSSVIVSTENERVVQYGYRPTVFNIVATPKLDGFTASEIEKSEHLSSFINKIVKDEGPNGAMRAPQMRDVSSNDYAVGAIPLQEGVSPSGARTYSIPITTATDAKFAPQVSLSYNSQAREGLAGYGWDISGISKISLINHNIYYHGKAKAAKSKDIDAVFALDGIPLVQNTDNATMNDYPLVTASGQIIAHKNVNSSGYVTSFNVRYPNGIKATYSLGLDANCNYPSYPITEMEDIDGHRITFSYTKELPGGTYRINYILYNYNSLNQPLSRINFYYNYDESLPSSHFAGKPLNCYYYLSRISSLTGGATLSTLSMDYIDRDNVKLLSEISCSNGTESYPPLKFDYGELNYWYSAGNATLERKNTFQYLTSTYTDTDCVYRRGKFVRNSFNDGLIIYPNHPIYSRIQSTWVPFKYYYLYGSPIAATQKILFVPQLGEGISSQVDDSIEAESGFQTIEAVDVDGDGVDELVKVNFNGTSGSKTILKITVYKCGSSGAPVLYATFNVQVEGVVSNQYYTSPSMRAYYWGDFNGRGTAQLLTIAYNTNGDGYAQACNATLIDLKTHTKYSEAVLFDFALSDSRNILVMDIDGDGRSELCHVTADGMDILRLQENNGFAIEESTTSLSATEFSSEQLGITDIDGDGYVDILWPGGISSPIWYRHAYTGEGFVNSLIDLGTLEQNDKVMFIDINQDNYPDLVKVSGTTLGVRMNQNGNTFGEYRQSTTSVADEKGILPGNVMDYLGMSSFIKIEGFHIYRYGYGSLSPKIRYLKESEDSFGNRLSNSYEYYPSQSRYWMTETYTPSSLKGYSKRALPIYILNAETGYLAPRNTYYKSISYSYYDPVVHNQGLGFCGFAKIKEYDISSHRTMTAMYHNPEKRGVLTKVERRNGYQDTSPLISTVENTYDNNTTTYGKLNPRLTKSIESNTLTGVETTTTYSYGSYNLPSEIVTSRRIGTGTAKTEKVNRTYENSVSGTKYILGVVKEESVIKEGDGSTIYAWKEKSINTYDSHYHLSSAKRYVGRFGRAEIRPIRPFEPGVDTLVFHATVQHVEPIIADLFLDATNLVSETHWQYDSHGNVVSETTAPYGTTEFVGNTYTYDSDGRYLLTKTDALGHTTTYSGYNKFGKPTTVKDYRNRTTTYTYDAWGNLVTTTHPDGTVEQTTVAWGGAGLYTVTRAVTGKPETSIHYDALGREIRSGVKRFNGQWQWTDQEYDSKGRLSRTSLPYRGTTAAYWNTYAYDEYNRPVSLTEASGKTSTWSYSGTSVTTVKDGISSTSTTDANGNVVSVTDPGGTITYTLRDDGQPSKVIAPGNVTTSFTYDDYGRRTKIIDPSAGTQTDAYVWNTDGSSVYTHTNPNGTVKTYKDKYGRTTLVERPGEYDTAYTYDTYGRLDTEQSTNGTGMEYTYDGLDRVVTTKETIPDGKWLRKVYSYGTAGILNSIRYVSQSGQITTESYTYSNGHNTGISLPDGTVVWSLTSENDLGMVTAIASGGITREYGFTAFGMPTYRKMDGGDLQDYTYNFDVATGNLLSRSDSVNGQTETFGYDNLNRLVAIGSRQVSYDNKGNILSIDGVGLMNYGSAAHPYRITTLLPEDDGLVPDRQQSISYTCYNRPSILTEGGRSAAFTYNGVGGRVKMYVADGATPVLSRYYIGGRYECDQTPSGSKERLYLGGDAYSAPMVLQRENNGSWTAYNIGRDYLGNITQIATLDGTLIAEYSYDPWGRLRNPETLEIYASGSEPELFLGRGFTGHEHLTWFGLVNMNARLYDPLLGRFLSPDPYVQAPDFTQNFNRYSYALNNPLRYTDESGEFALTTMLIVGGIAAAVFGIGNLVAHAIRQDDLGHGNWAKYFFSGAIAGFAVGSLGYLGYAGLTALSGMAGFLGTAGKITLAGAKVMAGLNSLSAVTSVIGGAINQGWAGVANAGKIMLGNFYLDENKSFFGQVWEGISRHTWEVPQQAVGYFWSGIRNCWADRVDYWGGATFITNFSSSYQGVTMGGYINIDNGEVTPTMNSYSSFDDYMQSHEYAVEHYYIHEYGHTIQSKIWGPAYLPIPALMSLWNCREFWDKHKIAHKNYWTEVWANTYSKQYYKKHFPGYSFPSSLNVKY